MSSSPLGLNSLPLEGIRVLDFSQVTFGPVCARLLGELGADVIKIEPLEGEIVRITTDPDRDSCYFLQGNRCKRSLALNLREPRGREIALTLARQSDVIVQNFRPGVMERLGLDYGTVSKLNPRIVYGSFSMYGDTGPLSLHNGSDPWAQAFTGVVSAQGSPEGPPYLAGQTFLDMGGAALNAFALVAALFMRDRTGLGQEVKNNLVNTGVFMQESALAYYMIDGKLLKKSGRGLVFGLFPCGAYRAKDGDVVTIFGQDDIEWPVVCSILGIEHILTDPRYDTHMKRKERRFELYPVLDEAFSKKTRQEWQTLFREQGLRCEPCLDYSEFVSHPQFKANDMVITTKHTAEGEMQMPGIPVKFSEAKRSEPLRAPPVLGEHSIEIVKGLGFSGGQVEALIAQGIIGVPTDDMLRPRVRQKSSDALPVISIAPSKKQRRKKRQDGGPGRQAD